MVCARAWLEETPNGVASINLRIEQREFPLLSGLHLFAAQLIKFSCQSFDGSGHDFHAVRQIIYSLIKSSCLFFLLLQLFQQVSKLIIVHG